MGACWVISNTVRTITIMLCLALVVEEEEEEEEEIPPIRAGSTVLRPLRWPRVGSSTRARRGTAAPDSFSPWGQTLGVVASRSRAAAKNEVLAKKAGVSYAHVDTSWLDAKRGYTSANAPIPPDTHVGALAVDAPPPSDDLSRIGAFLQVLSDHERLHQEDRVQQEGNGGRKPHFVPDGRRCSEIRCEFGEKSGGGDVNVLSFSRAW